MLADAPNSFLHIFLFLFALLQHAVDIRMIRKENVTTSRESLFGREHILI